MSTAAGAYFDQVQSLFDQLLLVSALLFGFSFAVVVQLSTNKEAAAYSWTRRLYFVALLLFVNATGSALILIIRSRNTVLNYVMPTVSSGDTDQAVLSILGAPWVSFVLTSLTISLIAGIILWMAGMVMLAVRDSRPFTLFVLASVVLILLLFVIGLTQLGA
jgi:hypothetical protein